MRLFKRQTPEDDPTSIGNVLVDMKLLTKDELDKIVAEFRASKEELLGQFIVRKSSVTEDQIELALIRQKVARGQGSQKMLDRLIEISQRSGQRVSTSLEELTSLAKTDVAKRTA